MAYYRLVVLSSNALNVMAVLISRWFQQYHSSVAAVAQVVSNMPKRIFENCFFRLEIAGLHMQNR